MRSEFLEALAETDEAMMNRYLAGEEFTEAEIKAALRKAVIARDMFPILWIRAQE